MRPFNYSRAADAKTALAKKQGTARSRFIGGGTNLLDLMKLDIEQPDLLIDINGLDLNEISQQKDGSVRIGALVRNSDLAYNKIIRERFPVLSEALLSGASPQLRNMATVGGNLLQRTRCPYFYDTAFACNKRNPGAGCDAIKGYNRNHAVLGTSEKCIAAHPSDMCVALSALDAVIMLQGPAGKRSVGIRDFHLLPGNTPERETVLMPDELITGVILPDIRYAGNSHYLKVRDRTSYEFALASAAVAMYVSDGTIREARIALGGVGTRPWRCTSAENAIAGEPATEATYRKAADIALSDARTQEYNAFKPELARRTLVQALMQLNA